MSEPRHYPSPTWEAKKQGKLPPNWCMDRAKEYSPREAVERGLGSVRRWFACSTGEHKGHSDCGMVK